MWFDVDKDGLAKLLEGRDRAFILYELLQNSWDEEGVTEVSCSLQPVPYKSQVTLRVEDDSPTGFRNLSHAWTLFAESYKKGNPDKRGKFNFGEKMVLALAEHAVIHTTKGTVTFGENGRIKSPSKRQRGSFIHLVLKMTREQMAEIEEAAKLVIPPEGITTIFNGDILVRPTPLKTFEATLPTEHADDLGNLRPTRRKTQVEVFEPLTGTGWLYEMGVPVVETGDRWSVNIMQKVPLNLNRDNVTPSFLRKVRAEVITNMAESLDAESASDSWVQDATGSKECSPEAFATVLDQRFGKNRVMFDPSDPEAGMNAVSKGYTLVTGRQLSKGQRDNLRRFRKGGTDTLRPAGQLFPTKKPYSSDPNAPLVDMIPPSEWTERQAQVVNYSKHVFKLIVGDQFLTVNIVRTTNYFAAAYGSCTLDFNYRRLGKRFFNDTGLGALRRLNDLLIHEFAHHYSSNHLDSKYHDAATSLGAKLTEAALLGTLRPQDFGFTLEP